MQTKRDVIQYFLGQQLKTVNQSSIPCFAPSNIALCKYWGKRDNKLNLPVNSSLSISLGKKGALAVIQPHHCNEIVINNNTVDNSSMHGKRLLGFIALFCDINIQPVKVDITINLPLAAGLASSACLFAALVKALNNALNLKLDKQTLSIMARLGSGSACRSLFNGFVEWTKGHKKNGVDSHGIPFDHSWPELTVGLCLVDQQPKKVSSREGMRHTTKTSALYASWPEKAARDLALLKQSIVSKNFALFGQTSENNALSMHATMLASWPPLCYFSPKTLTMIQKVWDLRDNGISVYFTQDAGANIKLLFLENKADIIRKHFQGIECIHPFNEVK